MDIKFGILPVFVILILVAVLQTTDAQGPKRGNGNIKHPQPLRRPNNNRRPNPKPYSPPQSYQPPQAYQPQQAYQPPPAYQPPQPYPPQGYPPAPNPGMPGIPGMPAGMNCTMMCMMRNEMDVSPRCGYDGKTYRNECFLRNCGMTYEACDGTCPCYGSLNSPPSYMMLQPAAGVFPAALLSGGKAARKRPARRPKGRRPNCFCAPTTEMICTERDKMVAGECEAYCTYQRIKCDGPCPCLRLGGLFGGMGAAAGGAGRAGFPG